MSKDTPSDFRYDTGDKAIPWAAVGEDYGAPYIVALIEFLVQKRDEQYDAILDRVREDISLLFDHGRPPGKLSLGSKVVEVEERAKEFLNCKYCTFITNATAGLEMALRCANLKEGDEIIVPAITFIATISYPLAVGAKIVFADVDPATLNIDPGDVERKLTEKTKAIIPVHMGGWPADMEPLLRLAQANDLLVVEDAAHAFGSAYKGKKAGTIGHFGVFSFHEVKNVTSFGEGGLIATDTDFGRDLSKARFLGLDSSTHIENWLYDVTALQGKYGPYSGGNCSATEIQAIGLLAQLARIEGIIATRRRNAAYLNSRFAESEAITPQLLDTEEIQSTYHLYLLQIDPDRAGGDIQRLKQKLEEKGVTSIPHFAPLYKFKLLRQLGYDCHACAESCPNAEEAFDRRFTHLPVYGFSDEQLDYLANAVLSSIEEMQTGR